MERVFRCFGQINVSPHTKNKSQNLLNKYMGNQIEKTTYVNHAYTCAVYATQGYRRSMEDRNIVCLSLPNHPDHAIFGVFDGFNGHYASQYLADNVQSELNKLHTLEDNNLIISTINAMDKKWRTFTNEINECKETNNDENIDNNTESIDEKYDNNAGSTIVFALIQTKHTSDTVNNEYKCRIFWAGDSRAIALIHNENNENEFEKHNLTIDHHCDLEKECKRIKNANGNIVNNRIDGQVAITRCFGCNVMKNDTNLPQNEQKMISNMEYKTLICKQDDMLLLFCDGLIAGNWSNDTVIMNFKRIYMQHKDEKNGLLNCLNYLAEDAMNDGSKDNITVICIRFINDIINNKQLKYLYLPSLSTGIYGSYLYNECISKRKCFQLKYIYDDEKLINNELTDIEKKCIIDFENLLHLKYGYSKNIDYLYSDLIRFVIGCKEKLDVAEERFLNLKKL
eukprot:440618_1